MIRDIRSIAARVRPAFATSMLQMGVSAGPTSDIVKVKDVVRRLHPLDAGVRLIREGDNGDGGYLLPDDLDGLAACFSPGVDDRASFELGMAARGVPCYMADGTVESSPVAHELLRFLPKNIAVVDGPHETTMDSWIDRMAPGSSDLILQMDIEGFEVPALLNISERNLRRFRVMAIEFHELDNIFSRHGLRSIGAVVDRLLTNHYVVHVHANNYGGAVSRGGVSVPRVIEATFLRKDRVSATRLVESLPHPLDVKNASQLADVTFPLLRM